LNYAIEGLSPERFRHLYGMPEDELLKHNARRYVCDESPGFPDRIEMRDLKIGESVLLVNYTSMDKETPYKASHAIYVKEGAENPYFAKNEIPDMMYNRLLSLRAFDASGMIIESDTAVGEEIEKIIKTMFSIPEVEHIDAHYAGRGCFAARITRA